MHRHRDCRAGLAGRRRDRHREPGLARMPYEHPGSPADPPRIALVTYSTKAARWRRPHPGAGRSADRLGVPVRIVALAEPGPGFFRTVRAPYSLVARPASRRHPRGAGVRLGRRAGGRSGADRRPGSTSCTPRTASRPAPQRASGTPAPACRWCGPSTTSTTSPPRS